MYIHKGEAENNEALVRQPGGNRENQADDKYRRRHTDTYKELKSTLKLI